MRLQLPGGQGQNPQRQDFLSKECFTPDCGGLINRFQIYGSDSSEKPRTVHDKKLMERLLAEEKVKKEEDKKKKAKETVRKYTEQQRLSSKLNNNNTKKERKKSIIEKDPNVMVDGVSSQCVHDSIVSDIRKKLEALPSPDPNENIPLDQFIILKKKQDVEVEFHVKKKTSS